MQNGFNLCCCLPSASGTSRKATHALTHGQSDSPVLAAPLASAQSSSHDNCKIAVDSPRFMRDEAVLLFVRDTAREEGSPGCSLMLARAPAYTYLRVTTICCKRRADVQVLC